MTTTMDRPRAEKLATAFMTDRLGMAREDVARLIHADDREMAAVTGGDGAVDETTRRQLRGLVAIQSLLLSAYTPEGAVAWMTNPTRHLDGAVPLTTLRSGGDNAIADVLGAAYGRVST